MRREREKENKEKKNDNGRRNKVRSPDAEKNQGSLEKKSGLLMGE